MHAAIITGAGRSNVTEWCKKDESWEYMKALDLPVSDPLPTEILMEPAEAEQIPAQPVHSEDEALAATHLDDDHGRAA